MQSLHGIKLILEILEFEKKYQNWNCNVLKWKEPSSNSHPKNLQTCLKLRLEILLKNKNHTTLVSTYLLTTRHLTYQKTLTLPTPTYQYGNKTPLKERWPELSKGRQKGKIRERPKRWTTCKKQKKEKKKRERAGPSHGRKLSHPRPL